MMKERFCVTLAILAAFSAPIALADVAPTQQMNLTVTTPPPSGMVAPPTMMTPPNSVTPPSNMMPVAPNSMPQTNMLPPNQTMPVPNARNTIEGTAAGGTKHTTIIDDNGNLKIITKTPVQSQPMQPVQPQPSMPLPPDQAPPQIQPQPQQPQAMQPQAVLPQAPSMPNVQTKPTP